MKGSPPRSLGDQANITNFSKLGNSSTKTLYRSEQGNVNHFKDHKSDNEFGSNIGNKRTQANLKDKKELFPLPPRRASEWSWAFCMVGYTVVRYASLMLNNA